MHPPDERIIVITKTANMGVVTSIILGISFIFSSILIIICFKKNPCKIGQSSRQSLRKDIPIENLSLRRDGSEVFSESTSFHGMISELRRHQPSIGSIGDNTVRSNNSFQEPQESQRLYKQRKRTLSSEASQLSACHQKTLSRNGINCSQSSQKDDISIDYKSEREPLARSFAIKNCNNECDNHNCEPKSRKTSHCECRYRCNEDMSEDSYDFKNNQYSLNSPIENVMIPPVKSRRKRLLSFQTSFENEPSEACTYSPSNCTVTVTDKLGNGIVKKTVYLYELDDMDTLINDDDVQPK